MIYCLSGPKQMILFKTLGQEMKVINNLFIYIRINVSNVSVIQMLSLRMKAIFDGS